MIIVYCLFLIVTMNNFWFTLTFAKKPMQALHEHVRIDIDVCILKPNFDGGKKKPQVVKWPAFKRTLCNVPYEIYAKVLLYSLVHI